MIQRDTYSVVKEKIPEGRTYCSLCSRLRRGILYDAAVDLGCTKIALGHHRDDTIQTLMLNLFFSGQLKAMPPRLVSDDGRNVVIRPLIYCEEDELAQYAEEKQFPILPCDLCGSQENLQRQQMKRMLNEWNDRNPKIKGNLFAALSNIRASHLLDPKVREAMGVDAVREDDASVLGLGAQQLLEERQRLHLGLGHHAIGADELKAQVEEDLPVLHGDVVRVDLLRLGRRLEVALDLGRLFFIEVELVDQLANERLLGVLDLQVGPRKGADEAHQAQAILGAEILERDGHGSLQR
jgi:tRNA 2-thiocytidine biosynthesis protein TtcA